MGVRPRVHCLETMMPPRSKTRSKQVECSSQRCIQLNDPLVNSTKGFASNHVSTAKYTIYTFIPKNLLEQFRRAANVYFLVLSVLTSLEISPKDAVSLIGTFALVLLVTAVKEAYEDYMRYRSDLELNHRKVEVLRCGEFQSIATEKILVGDVLRVDKNEPIPADCILLASSDLEHGVCYVDTCNLDGETNLKSSVALKETKLFTDPSQFLNLNGTVICEEPNPELYTFLGTITFDDGTPISLTPLHLLLRGSVLRNTRYAYGLAVYTGRDSKIMMNANQVPFKMSSVMNTMNQCLYFIFALQIVFCITNSIAAVQWRKMVSSKITYMDQIFHDDDGQLGLGFELESFLTFIIAYSNLIPISLYVGIEVMKLTQKYLINNDKEMYHAETNTPANSRTSNLVEELGQVEYIFSDKTGTLTCNQMEFLCCSIQGQSFDFQGQVKGQRCSPHARATSAFTNPTSWAVMTRKEEKGHLHEAGAAAAAAAKKNREEHMHFWLCLAICHTVVPEYERGYEGDLSKLKYQASSPDEAALVWAAHDMGFVFHTRTPESITLTNHVLGREETFKILNILPFDSTRKRMTVIVQDGLGRIKVFSKGADNIMLPRNSANPHSAVVKDTLQHLHEYSKVGLRTLCLAYKELSQEDYLIWQKAYLQASLAFEAREVFMEDVANAMEKNLILLGATAIEDKLQEGVPDAIASLKAAGIRVWVLTGDKEETAVNVGHACELLNKTMFLHRLSLYRTADDMLEYLVKQLGQDRNDDDDDDEKRKRKVLANSPSVDEAIVVDGDALHLALSDKVQKAFLALAVRSKVCICCRVSPKQKAQVVRLVKEQLKVVTLAIGDGANDVSMIQEAHIGVGISGQEGMQAVRSSDYSVAQFRFLQRLVLIHGAWAYQRITKFVLYYFYKNIVMVLTEYWFAWVCGFSGQILFADWLAIAYNAVYTSYPCVAGFALDQYVSSTSLLKYPKLYKTGQRRELFNAKEFIKYTVLAMYHSFVCYYVPVATFRGSAVDLKGQATSDLWYTGTVSFTCVILVVTLKMLLEVTRFNAYVKWVSIISLIVYFISIFFLCAPQIASMFQPELNSMIYMIAKHSLAYLSLFVTCVLAILPDILSQFMQRNYSPQPLDIVQELEKTIHRAEEKEKGALTTHKVGVHEWPPLR